MMALALTCFMIAVAFALSALWDIAEHRRKLQRMHEEEEKARPRKQSADFANKRRANL